MILIELRIYWIIQYFHDFMNVFVKKKQMMMKLAMKLIQTVMSNVIEVQRQVT